jgi:hypothetical protein
MIPRVIHWLWLGPAPVPDLFTHYTDSWRRHHPAWATRLWRDDTLGSLSGLDAYAQATGFKRRYDVLRLEIVRQHGGVILDLDVEAIRPIDPLLPGISGFIGRVTEQHVGNQVLGAVPNHPFFEEAVARLRVPGPDDATSSEAVGKTFLKQVLADRPDGMTVFPPETFHYQPSFDPPRRPEAFPSVYAVHHELASYSSPPDPGEVEAAIDNVIAAALAARDVPNEKRLARLRKHEQRLRRAVARQARGYEALLRRAAAEREQIEARLRQIGPTV